MSIKRYTGSGFTEITSRKRWNGSAWVNLTFGRRWNGSGWVDLWSNSQGGGSENPDSSGGGEGWLFKDLKSTVSHPTVHYSCEYALTNTGVKLAFKSWLNSSNSTLGNGIKLTVFARLNSGQWFSAVLKSVSVTWSGTGKHTAALTLSGAVTSKTKVEIYVTRAGSTYGGSAGKIASASSPKTYYIN